MNDWEETARWWEAYFALFVTVVLPALLIVWGLTVGRMVEKRHLRRLSARRQATSHVLVTDVRTFPHVDGQSHALAQPPPQLLIAEAVIAADYLKTFLASLRKIVGGELRSYESLMFRAREEAILRIIEQAQAEGYDGVCNLRLETADIGAGSTNSKRKAAFVAVIASGTAYRRGAAAAAGGT